ncbi:MAG: alpha/beta hydrolase [Pseudonocardia sp.]|nr:alpha/beta hydrolase [Pseudonocardia sp.]
MTTGAQARNGAVELAYERHGSGGEPLLLVSGLGVQLTFWPDGLLAEFTRAGFDVARFDNRDVGRSTALTSLGVPSLARMLTRPRSAARYLLSDMAADAVAVLDALGWESAHVFGASMGGMIAQTLAIEQPSRVRSLISVMSTTGPRIARPHLRAALALATPPARTPEESAERVVNTFRTIGSPGYPLDEDYLRAYGREAFRRGRDPHGGRRQLAAILASPDRAAGLAGVTVPTLVLHGEQDPLVPVSGGRATAAAVPGARLVTFPGMGHNLPRELWPQVAAEAAALANR